MKKEFILKTSGDTKKIGWKIGSLISSSMTIFLCGDLGSGKTTFVQGIAKGLKIPDGYYITSPSYSIINEYPGRLKFYHIDLYRIEDIMELDSIGFDEIMDSDNSVIAIEWPDILLDNPSHAWDLKIDFSHHGNLSRKISIFSSGRNGSNLLENLLL